MVVFFIFAKGTKFLSLVASFQFVSTGLFFKEKLNHFINLRKEN